MTKQPESGGSSLPRDSSMLGRELRSVPPVLGSRKGTRKPNAIKDSKSKIQNPSSTAQPSQSPAQPLASPDPKLRRRKTSLARKKPDSNKLETQPEKQKRSSRSSDQTKVQPRLSTPAPLARRKRGGVEKQLDSKQNQLGFLKPPTLDPQLLSESAKHWGCDEELAEFSEPDRFGKRFVPIPSFLFSTAVHLAVFLALAFVVYKAELPTERGISILAEFDTTPTPIKPTEKPATEVIEIVNPLENRSPLEMNSDALSTDADLELSAQTDVLPSIVENDSKPNPVENATINAVALTLPSGGGLEGREEASRARLAASRGGSRASETAVENGIRWIINHQRDDGSWRLRHIDGKCNGECRNEGKQESATGATGLALMALLGAGYTQRDGRYKEEVQKGLNYLIEKMRVSAHGGSLAHGNKGMYSHAIATIALSEAYIMTRDTSLVQPISLARDYIETAQHKKGGWRYVPGSIGDMTVTGWQVMALRSCERAGFQTGELTWERAREFVGALGNSDGRFGYQSPDAQTPTTTAVGLLSKMYLGAALEDDQVELGAQYLIREKPSKTDMYFNYYATLVLHHRSDEDWPKWNVELRDYLINTQENGNSHSAGSWYFADQHGAVGGRLYTTAMAVMTLEVYYRYLPLYNHKRVAEAH